MESVEDSIADLKEKSENETEARNALPKFWESDMATNNNDTRPSWDEYFIRIAKDVSTRSNCCRRHVGAVIVRDNHIVSTGYNGTPIGTRNCFDGGCPRCNSEHKTGEKLEECLCVHAEQNAICQAARLGNAIDGGTIYVTCSPCLTCLKLLINSGIRKVVYDKLYKPYNEQERKLIEDALLTVIWRERQS